MTTTSFYRFSGFVLLMGIAINLVASIWPFFINTSLSTQASEYQSPQVAVYYSLCFIVFCLIMIGLPAMYLRVSGRQGGKLGFIGLLLVLFSFFFKMSTIAFFVTVLPLLAEQVPDTIETIFDSSFAIFPLGGLFLGLIGFILLGITVIRTKVFSSYVGVLIIVSAVVDMMQVAFENSVGGAIQNLVFALFFAAAFIPVGLSLLSGRQSVEAGSQVTG